MKTKHSPGPWVATGYRKSLVNDNDNKTICCFPSTDGTVETAAANAALIAAAPELLSALRYLYRESAASGMLDVEPSMQQASAAIAKATQGI